MQEDKLISKWDQAQEAMLSRQATQKTLNENFQKLKDLAKMFSEESKSQSELLDFVPSNVDSPNTTTDSSLANVKKL